MIYMGSIVEFYLLEFISPLVIVLRTTGAEKFLSSDGLLYLYRPATPTKSVVDFREEIIESLFSKLTLDMRTVAIS